MMSIAYLRQIQMVKNVNKSIEKLQKIQNFKKEKKHEKENSIYSDTMHNAYLYACNFCKCRGDNL